MDRLLDESERALGAELWLLAVTGALLVPDIAAALRHPSGATRGDRYRDWWNDVGLGVAYEGYLSADDAYKYRCSLTHQGTGHHPSAASGRVIFTPPTNVTMHKIRMGGVRNAVVLDIVAFVGDLVNIGRGWLNANRDDPVVSANLARSVSLHPQGIAPFIVGSPVIG